MNTLHGTPLVDGFSMPGEWEPHERTWMIWPERTDTWRLDARPAAEAFAAVATAIAGFEPVTLCVSATRLEHARAVLATVTDTVHGSRPVHPIDLLPLETDDAWMRDTGPSFVRRPGEVRGVDWEFNAWGGHTGGLYHPWDRDNAVAHAVLEHAGCHRYHCAGFVLEGGSIHVDGEGTVITTEECLLNPNRNPHLNRHEIELNLRGYLGVQRVIWLPAGLYNDETDGHVDNLCCFIRPGEVLLAWCDNPHDPNYVRCREAARVLETATDARGRLLRVHRVPIPGPLFASAVERESLTMGSGSKPRCEHDRLAASYVNFYLANGGVIAPRFDVPEDAEAMLILEHLFPDRRVVMLPGREILLGGGNMHCITQQQPRA